MFPSPRPRRTSLVSHVLFASVASYPRRLEGSGIHLCGLLILLKSQAFHRIADRACIRGNGGCVVLWSLKPVSRQEAPIPMRLAPSIPPGLEVCRRSLFSHHSFQPGCSHVDVYMFPDPTCVNPSLLWSFTELCRGGNAAGQVDSMISYLESHGIHNGGSGSGTYGTV
jgi:hypothetical protein